MNVKVSSHFSLFNKDNNLAIMPVKKDDGAVGKILVGLAVVAGGVVAVLAFWKWKQGGSAGSKKPPPVTSSGAAKAPAAEPKPAAAETKPAPPPAAAKPAAAAPPPAAAAMKPAAAAPPPAAAAPVAKPAPPPAAPAAVTKPVETKPAPPSQPAVPQPAAKSVLHDAPPPQAEAKSIKPTTPPISGNGDGNSSDLSMSATFEKVNAPSLTLSSMSASFSGSTTPPSGPSSLSKPPSLGGPKSEELHCDSSRESPVFGGLAYSALDESEVQLSNFDPSKHHPAFFGFKFDGATS